MLNTLQLFFDSIADYALIRLNKEGIIKACNKAIETITGFSPEELVGRPLSVIYTDIDKKSMRAEDELEIALQKGKFEIETWKVKKDGSKFWAITSITPFTSGNADQTGFAIVIKDVTARMRQQLEMKEKEQQYRLMVEEVKDYGIFMLDPKGYIVTWNEGAKKIKGYHKDEIIGKHFSVFYTAAELDQQIPKYELEVAIETGRFEAEGWRVKKGGSLFWANIVITALYNEYNKHIGFSKVTRDLSKKKEEEDALKQNEERHRLLVEQVKDYGIFMLDERGRITSWNEGARRMKGYTADEIIGKYFSIFYTDEDKINEKPAMELRVAKEAGKYEEEGWRLRKDGSVFWANVVITAIFNPNGQFLGYAKVTRNLTERKEAERAMKESSEKYKLLAEQLRQTNDNLAYANKELEEFTSIVSHDLQEPVRTIKSFLLIADKKLSDAEININELRTYLQKAIKAGDRMKELILNLLSYAQVSKAEVINAKINVNDLIGEVLQNLKHRIDATGAKITVNTETEFITGDPIQLMQLVQNLVSNALKFIDNKKPEVSIHCKTVFGKVLFSISDNGIGIAKDSQNKIFEIFRREYTAKDYPGTGIGLSICKKIVDRHNGRIWPESELGKGTTFYFTLNDENALAITANEKN